MATVIYMYCLQIVVCLCCFAGIIVTQELDQPHPTKDFKHHTLIRPKVYYGREKRQVSTTTNQGTTNHHHITVKFEHNNRPYILDLSLNRNLIPQGFFYKYQKNGSNVIEKPTADEVELCHYQGKLRNKPDSWAAISTCDHTLRGVMFDGNEIFYIEKNSNDDEHHFLYKHSDMTENNKKCGYEGDAQKHGSNFDKFNDVNRILRYRRNVEPVKGPYNANKRSRYVELVLVVDNSFYKELESKVSKVDRYCKDITNIINGLYSSLNIFIALVGVVIWTENDEIKFSENGDETLTNFLHYRREHLIQNHPNDNAQLITKFSFNNGVVGKALKGPICTYLYSGGVNNNHSPVIGLVATTIAHEMGHNFGMEHDTNECACPDDRCIMAPSSSSVAPKHWSNCSLEYLALAFEHGMDYCLRNKPASLFGSPVCGNGFVEPGEQCDCGLPEHCDNSCCNATTCSLNANASCATGECCDLTICKPKKPGTMCRSADIECDLPEYCTGHSEYCPPDTYKQDTETCDGGKAYCYHGYCRTRSDQCKLLWGNTGKTSDEQCYKMNTKGNRHGNCGYNKLNQEYVKCEDEHVLCGMLHCKHLNERLEFGMESVAILSHSFLNLKGSIIPCRTAIVDLGLNQVDPGLAPDGAKCGDGKMCVNQKCLPVEVLRVNGPHCPNNCNGNGVCNNLGHCHCKDGFAPPSCEYPGPGGSQDSGPASDPNARKGFVAAICIIFLGIIPGMAIVSFMVYYAKQNMKLSWTQSLATSKTLPQSRGPASLQPITNKKSIEDSHSLLTEEAISPLKCEFFGHFKGFTISKKTFAEPSRPAPPVPVIPKASLAKISSPNLKLSNSSEISTISQINKPIVRSLPISVNSSTQPTSTSIGPPALPPLNNPTNSRPLISSPILENSTCTAKELLSPLKSIQKVPIRPAPDLPVVNNEPCRPLSAIDTVNNSVTEVQKKPLNGNALTRITSFLRQVDRKPQVSNTTNSFQGYKKVIDKNTLRTLEISNPILQNDINSQKTVPITSTENSAVVMRAQSLRGPTNVIRPAIPKFGSMRQPNVMKRPMSIPSASRPKSPPPPRPPIPEIIKDRNNLNLPKSKDFNDYIQPCNMEKQSHYDDCLNEVTVPKMSDLKSPSSDNIYAVIDETPVTSGLALPDSKNVTSNTGSSESFGLLGEIVSEIQNRNFDSIYSTSTLARKKKIEDKLNIENGSSETYMNTESVQKPDGSVYSNMNNVKSSASSTSSGYIAPSSVNFPVKQLTDVGEKKSSISKDAASEKHLSTNSNRSSAELTSKDAKSLDGGRRNSKYLEPHAAAPEAIFSNIKSTKPLPSRPIVKSNTRSTTKSVKSNSPDLVTSCANKKSNGSKTPDVLNGSMKKPATLMSKPHAQTFSKNVPKVNKPLNIKNIPDIKASDNKLPAKNIKSGLVSAETNKVMPPTVRSVVRQQSNVASLQQKFENKSSSSARPVALSKK